MLQWRYVAGNNWGRCADGTEAIGCGPQEEFRACSDIAIGKILTEIQNFNQKLTMKIIFFRKKYSLSNKTNTTTYQFGIFATADVQFMGKNSNKSHTMDQRQFQSPLQILNLQASFGSRFVHNLFFVEIVISGFQPCVFQFLIVSRQKKMINIALFSESIAKKKLSSFFVAK